MKKEIYDLLGEWRIWLLIIAVIASLFALSPNPWAKGAVVQNVDEESPFAGKLEQGTIINSINEETVSGSQDLYEYDNYTGMVRMETSDGLKLAELSGQDLGVTVEERDKINLNFGLDLRGGTRVLLEPQFNESEFNETENETFNATDRDRLLDQTISTLQTRLNVFGLKEMNFQKVSDVTGERFIQIEAAGATRETVDELLKRRGNFEAYIPIELDLKNTNQTTLSLGEESFSFEKSNGNVTYQDEILETNSTLTLNDIEFEVWNKTDSSVLLAGKVFDSESIGYVYTSGSKSYVRKSQEGNSHNFQFQVLISEDGAERFGMITANLERGSMSGDGSSLSQQIHLFLDESEVSTLNINSELKGEEVTEPSITGGAETKEQAFEEMRQLQSVMKSGKLPVELKTAKVDTISPRLGQEFTSSIIIAGIGAILIVALIIFIRYRNLKIIIPVLITSFSEILIVMGAASAIGWTIDLAAIAGVIAAIGSSVDDQIVITSETMREDDDKSQKYSVKRRVKRAFFIVFTAAATTIVAMTTLAFIGIGMMRGFAITTMIGVLAGIIITRPAYGKILEKVI
ncbi:MAG: MMPL family transporter [Candidatus Aenigmatarchaeota archaeon]